ncbi:STAS domain-containing protein [Mycolicibacterium wolinskyi]|uniref:STAS domain-containing protein n=1 Tax=Mycolicibacterium wolinskyi TaxID=59750 RepID=UPI0039178747
MSHLIAHTKSKQPIPTRSTVFGFTTSQPWPGVTLCSVSGALDACTADQFRTELLQALDAAAATVVVDLSRIEFLGVAGLQALLQAQTWTENRAASSRFRLVTGVRCADRLLEISGHRSSFDTYQNLDAALHDAATVSSTGDGNVGSTLGA